MRWFTSLHHGLYIIVKILSPRGVITLSGDTQEACVASWVRERRPLSQGHPGRRHFRVVCMFSEVTLRFSEALPAKIGDQYSHFQPPPQTTILPEDVYAPPQTPFGK